MKKQHEFPSSHLPPNPIATLRVQGAWVGFYYEVNGGAAICIAFDAKLAGSKVSKLYLPCTIEEFENMRNALAADSTPPSLADWADSKPRKNGAAIVKLGKDPNQLITTQQLAAYLKVSESLIYNWRAEGKGPTYQRMGTKTIRYRVGDVRAWQEEQDKRAE